MISLDMKNEVKSTTSSSTLNLSTPSDEPTLSFSELLSGVSEKRDSKVIQNGSLILSLGDEAEDSKDLKTLSKGDALLSLLKGEEALDTKPKEAPLQFNPVITAELTTKDLKALIKDAKSFLKDKLEESSDFKMAQIKDLPKTLKGLVEVAKKFGIDISKITIEEVKTHAETKGVKQDDVKTLSAKDAIAKAPVNDVADDKKADATSHVKDLLQSKGQVNDDKELKSQTSVEKESSKEKEVKVQAQSVKDVQPQDKEIKVQAVKDIQPQDREVKVQAQTLKDVQPQDKEVKVQAQTLKDTQPQDREVKVQAQAVKDTQPQDKDVKIQAATEKEVVKNIERDVHVERRVDEKVVQTTRETKATPLFKAQTVVEHTTTEQIVQVKQLKVEEKTPKDRADETLKLLLRGEKPSVNNPALTADFSVATAKVIASNAATDATKALEQLLHGDTSSADDGVDIVKTETSNVHNDDGFEAKLKEAKQMIKYLSSDIKTAIEDYKSPFHRVKVQLNPQKLGEVDLTVVQRGKNLHVNLSSNNAAINTLVMNASELKTQLSNSGINNATLNFNNSSQNGENAGQQQQNRHSEREAYEEYNYFDQEESNEEILSSLEIVVPQYG